MSGKKHKKKDWRKQYDFDISDGIWILKEKKQFIDIKRNPTAIIYVRVSDRKQVEEWNWLESQEATCRRRAEEKGISIIRTFSDEGISWAELWRRGLLDAIDFLKKENTKYPKISYFLCTEISRISRSEDIEKSGMLKKTIEDTNTEIVTTSNGVNISKKDTTNSFMTDIQLAVAKNERLQIRERSLNGSRAKLYNGERIFSPPVGYERIHIKKNWKIEKVLQVIEPQASIIKEWLELFADGIISNNSGLLEFFNEKKLKSNYHSPNPWKLNLTFIQRILEIERLYFYAGYIFYPNENYQIIEPIQAIHPPLVSLSIIHKIIKRIDKKGNIKVWPRKDTSDIYPLRGVIFCVNCDHPMTGRASRWKMGKLYYYYGCNRKDCNHKENIRIEEVHYEYEKLLSKLSPKKWVMNLIDVILKEVIKEKNKTLNIVNEERKKRINNIDQEISSIENKIEKLTKIELIQKLEIQRALLEEEKENLYSEIQENSINENDFLLLYDKVRVIIETPLTIRELGNANLKLLQAWVLFWEKIYYTKNEGFQTLQISALHNILDHLNDGNISSGAGDGTRTRNSLLGRQAL